MQKMMLIMMITMMMLDQVMDDFEYYADFDDAGTSDKSILRRASLFSHRPSVFSIQVMMRC